VDRVQSNPITNLVKESLVFPDPPLFSSIPLLGWAILAVAAVATIWIALKIVRKAIKVSIRLGLVIGVLALIAAGLCWLSSLLGNGELPVL
jgi:hypothetical protein